MDKMFKFDKDTIFKTNIERDIFLKKLSIAIFFIVEGCSCLYVEAYSLIVSSNIFNTLKLQMGKFILISPVELIISIGNELQVQGSEDFIKYKLNQKNILHTVGATYIKFADEKVTSWNYISTLTDFLAFQTIEGDLIFHEKVMEEFTLITEKAFKQIYGKK